MQDCFIARLFYIEENGPSHISRNW